MAKIINGSSLYLALANYLASNAYLNDTAQDVLEMVCVWIDEAKAIQVPKWIPVTERLPEEHESIFAMLYGTKLWEPAMFRTTSDDVLAVVKFKDGKRAVKTVCTTDGEWRLLNIFGARDITHWMPLPEPPKEVE